MSVHEAVSQLRQAQAAQQQPPRPVQQLPSHAESAVTPSSGSIQGMAVGFTPAAVRAHHLGAFAFKGSREPADMVSVATAAIEDRHRLLPTEDARGKGRRVSTRSGVASAAIMPLPDVLLSLRDSFSDVAGASAGGNEGAAAAYASWLSVELTRRHVLWCNQ